MAVAAGWTSESRIHRLLTRQKKPFRIPWPPRGEERNLRRLRRLQDARECNEPPVDQIRATYLARRLRTWRGPLLPLRAESSDFPGIDSLLLFHPPSELFSILFVFRIAWNQGEHGVGADGLRKVGGLEFPSNARRCYVIITPERIWLEMTVPMERFWEIGQHWKLVVPETFSAFHCLVRTLDHQVMHAIYDHIHPQRR